jgi:hypothetical protein
MNNRIAACRVNALYYSINLIRYTYFVARHDQVRMDPYNTLLNSLSVVAVDWPDSAYSRTLPSISIRITYNGYETRACKLNELENIHKRGATSDFDNFLMCCQDYHRE